jgi:hypothetical protein
MFEDDGVAHQGGISEWGHAFYWNLECKMKTEPVWRDPTNPNHFSGCNTLIVLGIGVP